MRGDCVRGVRDELSVQSSHDADGSLRLYNTAQNDSTRTKYLCRGSSSFLVEFARHFSVDRSTCTTCMSNVSFEEFARIDDPMMHEYRDDMHPSTACP
jgi:hypothetical protein